MTLCSKAVETAEKALAAGARLRAFCSGGGLRVLRLEKGGELVGYGEHLNVEGAFELLAEDFEAGHRSYGDVYGVLHPHHMAGSSDWSSALDAWVQRGSKFHATAEDSGFVLVLTGHRDSTPWDQITRTGKGTTLALAMEQALAADPVEEGQEK